MNNNCAFLFQFYCSLLLKSTKQWFFTFTCPCMDVISVDFAAILFHTHATSKRFRCWKGIKKYTEYNNKSSKIFTKKKKRNQVHWLGNATLARILFLIQFFPIIITYTLALANWDIKFQCGGPGDFRFTFVFRNFLSTFLSFFDFTINVSSVQLCGKYLNCEHTLTWSRSFWNGELNGKVSKWQAMYTKSSIVLENRKDDETNTGFVHKASHTNLFNLHASNTLRYRCLLACFSAFFSLYSFIPLIIQWPYFIWNTFSNAVHLKKKSFPNFLPLARYDQTRRYSFSTWKHN